MNTYTRYHIDTAPAPDRYPHPSRFRVRVKKHRLIRLLLKELVEYRGNMPVVLSRPCVYGVFSGPVGGLAPREHLCVGCLRCTTEHPEIVQIHPNPERAGLGDGLLDPDQVDTILYEARTGRVPVRGAGYRGPFGGEGWDGMWTDMSEIVRPTRDGIHGREFISTVTEIGEKPMRLTFDARGIPTGESPRVLTLQVPFFFDVPPRSVASEALYRVLVAAARRIDTVAVVPASFASALGDSPHVIPLVRADPDRAFERFPWVPRMILLDGWDLESFGRLRRRFPETIIGVRVPAETDVAAPVRAGARVLHLAASWDGRAGGRFAGDVFLEAHRSLVGRGMREEVTLIGGGGVTLAEHVPKAIICGLDAVALDRSPLIALQARTRRVHGSNAGGLWLPHVEHAWAVQRLVNLSAAWRDQLLEILGAMGLREVRRLRGETGRCMFQNELEREAFSGIQGYEG